VRILHEPLLHFLAIGALLFVLYGLTGDRSEDDPRQITVTQAKVDHLAELWLKTRQRPPTERELKGLVDDYVIEEILYREARALRLDEDDIIIRRRLRQKMEFVTDELADTFEPTEADLQTYLDEHPDYFMIDARISFKQLFFNPDRRGESTTTALETALSRLRNGSVSPDDQTISDGIPLPYELDEASTTDVEAMFGRGFASQLLGVESNVWTGPVESGYGLHLVYVSAREPGRIPRLDEVRSTVEREWGAAKRSALRKQVYQGYRDLYEITFDVPGFGEDGE